MQLYHEPENVFVAQFIGNPKMNLLPVTCVGAGPEGVTVELGGQRALIPVEPGAATPGQKLRLGIRPEHVRVGEGELTLTITPTVIERLGQQTIGYAQAEGASDTFCLVLPGETAVGADRPLQIGIRAADCHLFDPAGPGLPPARRPLGLRRLTRVAATMRRPPGPHGPEKKSAGLEARGLRQA